MKRLLTILIFLTCSFSMDSFGAVNRNLKKSKPMIKVRIGKSLNKILISGTDISRKFHSRKGTKKFKGRKSIKFNCKNFSKKNRSFKKPILLASLASPTGLVSLKKDKYHGTLHVVTSPSSKSCDVVNETTLDNYISSLLSKEMNAVWPIEALKAQAVASRTYALHMMKTRQVTKQAGHETYYDLESSEKHQVGGSFFDATQKTVKATFDTEGYVLKTKGGKLIPAFFHAKCGGKTLLPNQVWDNSVKGYKSVPCPYCHNHGKKSWSKYIKISRFKKFMHWLEKKKYLKGKLKSVSLSKIKIFPDKFFKSKLRVYFGSQVRLVEKALFRKFFGRVQVPSNNFLVSQKKKGLKFFGRGLGHGVGMCQLGALNLAKKGYSFKRILSHYFPNHKLVKVY